MDKSLRRPVIAGNWKMNNNPEQTKALIEAMKPLVADADCDVVICAPYIDLYAAMEAAEGSNIMIGAENCHWAEKGAFTGEVSAEMLKAAGVPYVIIGHSERRQYFGETDETVNKRTKAALAAGLKVILCLGEVKDERLNGITNEVVRMQTKLDLLGVSAEEMKNVMIPFQDPAVYGRSTLENSSFLASSANPDENIHGRGFVSRLTGSTTEAISMWARMYLGTTPFVFEDGKLGLKIKPILEGEMFDENGEVIGRIKPNDMVIFFNYRNDRAKEITVVLTQQDMPEAGMKTMPLYYCCMTPYDAKFEGLHILFDKENVRNTIGEYVSSLGLSQLRIAETEKYAHVTFFLNGGREAEFENESRILVASPKVATYDLQPEMSAYEVKDKLVEALNSQKFDFICLNFANGDMVGHTGIYEAIEKAVKAVDECVAEVVETAKANGYEVVMIADHGNADNAVNEDGSPNTAHSLNPVPIVVVSDRVAKVEDGILADVAPTVLKLMGLPQPAEMSGKALVELK